MSSEGAPTLSLKKVTNSIRCVAVISFHKCPFLCLNVVWCIIRGFTILVVKWGISIL